MPYFVISVSADGIRICDVADPKETVQIVTEQMGKVQIFDGLPDSNPNYWDTPGDATGVLIIKGEIVVPKPTKVVTKWEL